MRHVLSITLVATGWLNCAAAGEVTPIPPAKVVEQLVDAAKANDLNALARRLDCGKVAMGPHGRSLADTVAFLRTIELDTAEIMGTSTPMTPAPEHERVTLRTADREFRFDLELRGSMLVLGEKPYSHREITAAPHYVVTEIHQHP